MQELSRHLLVGATSWIPRKFLVICVAGGLVCAETGCNGGVTDDKEPRPPSDAPYDNDVAPDAQDAADDEGGICPIMGSREAPTFGSAACDTCMGASCCEMVTECFSVADCSDLVTCVKGCDGGQECGDTCRSAHPDSIGSVLALSRCFSNRCEASGCPPFP